MPALTGPIPKREESRVRDTEPGQEITKIKMKGRVTPPDLRKFPDQITHPIAKAMWDSFKDSGQVLYWEPSDWTTALMALSLLSKQLHQDKQSPTMIAACWQMLTSLAITEGERRRIRLEVERVTGDTAEEDGAKVIPISEVIANRLRSQQQA